MITVLSSSLQINTRSSATAEIARDADSRSIKVIRCCANRRIKRNRFPIPIWHGNFSHPMLFFAYLAILYCVCTVSTKLLLPV